MKTIRQMIEEGLEEVEQLEQKIIEEVKGNGGPETRGSHIKLFESYLSLFSVMIGGCAAFIPLKIAAAKSVCKEYEIQTVDDDGKHIINHLLQKSDYNTLKVEWPTRGDE